MARLASGHSHQRPCRVWCDAERCKLGRGGNDFVFAIDNRDMDVGIVKAFDHAPRAFRCVGRALVCEGGKQNDGLARLGLDDFRFGGDGNAAETGIDANGKRQAVTRLGQPCRRRCQLPEGHVLPLRALFQKIIDHRCAEQRSAPPVCPKGALKVERKQSHRLAAPETFTHPFMHCYIDKGILDGGHVETYSGTTGPCEALSASS